MGETRDYRCRRRGCGVTVQNPAGTVPAGWMGVVMYPGSREEPIERLGLFCSTACLLTHMEQSGRERIRSWRPDQENVASSI